MPIKVHFVKSESMITVLVDEDDPLIICLGTIS